MDVKDKIDILLAEIRELALLNPQSPSFQLGLDISSGYYSDESRLYMEYAEDLITIDDKVSILNKFEADGLIKGLEFDKQMAYFAINDLDVESDSNPYQDSKSGAVILRIKPDKTDLDRGILVLSTGENIYISGQAGNENNPLRLLKTLNKDTSKE